MNWDTSLDGAATPDDDQLGSRIAGLSTLERETSASFLAGIRAKIHRRATAFQLLSFSWQMPVRVVTELSSMLRHLLGALGDGKGR